MDSAVVYKILSEELQKDCNRLEGQLKLTNNEERIKEISDKTSVLNDFVRRVFNRLQMAEYVSA